MKLVLASGSEWRKELLSWLKIPFEVAESGIDETVFGDEEPSEVVARLATMKAEKVAQESVKDRVFGGEEGGEVVIGADTVVYLDGHIIGKPENRADAQRIISLLAGKTHEVWTGVCVMDLDTRERRVEVEKTLVTFRPIGAEEVEQYLNTKEWEGKAGGYQIQGAVQRFVMDIQGSYTNVIGLPLLVIENFLEEMGIGMGLEVREVIRTNTGYES